MIRFAGENELTDPASLLLKGEVCVRAVNYDIDDAGNAISRDGFSEVVAGATSSLWRNYCVRDGKICYFNGATATPMSDSITVLSDVYFEQVNNMVVFSDGSVYGTIDAGVISLVDNVTDWAALASDMEQWVKDKAPADFQAIASNFEVDTFKLSTQAGKYLCFADGCVYFAIDLEGASWVFRTDAFNVERTDVRFNVVAGFPDTITGIRAVADGLYVGTTGGSYFLEGHAFAMTAEGEKIGGFKQERVDTYGMIPGTTLTILAAAIPGLAAKGDVAIWACRQGVMVGVAGGAVKNLSEGLVELPDAPKGTAFLKEFTALKLKQYIACFDVSDDIFEGSELIDESLIGTRVVCLSPHTPAKGDSYHPHSRYERYPFNSFSQVDGTYYGANALGIFSLTGDTDNGVQIDTTALSLVTDFELKTKKNVPDCYTYARSNGEMLIDVYADEVLSIEDAPVRTSDATGVQKRRCKLSRKLFASAWQFRVRNQDGDRNTLFGIDPVVVKSKTRIS